MLFDQPGSSTRPALNAALEHTAALIWSRDPNATIYVNGSYVTEAADPVDVDLAVRSDVWDDARFVSAFAAAYPNEQTLIDFYFNAHQSSQHMEDLFREVRGSGTKKGIIQLVR